MLFSPLIMAAAEAQGGINRWLVGGIVLACFLVAMGILLAIGRGREHS